MLYLIGIGLKGYSSLTLEGYETIKKCSKVFLESYTSVIPELKKLKTEVGAIEVDRNFIESEIDGLIKDSKNTNIAILIIGDVFGATTHTDLILRAKEMKAKVKILGNQSIISAVGMVGLSLYKFGKIASIPFDNDNIKTPAKIVKKNLENGMHSLVLLDLNPIEKNFLTIKDAIAYLVRNKVIKKTDKIVACSRIGARGQRIKSGKASVLKDYDYGKPPYCVIIPSKDLHFVEEDVLETWTSQ